jgi:hypothetical protein
MGVIMQKRFERDYAQVVLDKERIAIIREKPVHVRSLSDKQPMTVLEDLIKMWPTHDIRYKGWNSSDDELMTDMVQGTDIRVVRKDISAGILDISVEMVRNLDEIERYNAATASHNKKWRAMGSPTEVFDPVHGDSHKVRDQYVDPVMMQSRHYDLPESAYRRVSTGKLAQARPEIVRKSHIKLRYQLQITDALFTLGYAAYDYEGRIIYYNQVRHNDLAYLVRRSVQEIWGNPACSRDFGELFEGVAMLLNGRKLGICKRDNKLPEFLAYEVSQVKSTEELDRRESSRDGYVFVGNLFGFYMPIVIIVGFVVLFFVGFLGMTKPEADSTALMLCIVLMVVTVICRIIAQGAERKASEIDSGRRFM